MVLLSKGKCLVMDEFRKKLISGVHILDNCYGLVLDANIVCNCIHLPNEDLWHQRMGHASYIFQLYLSMSQFWRYQSLVERAMWRVDHVSLGNRQKLNIHTLKYLLHLDLMGPTRIESLGGKRYIVVVVDNFTRYIWVILLRSKSDAPEHIEALCTRLPNEKSPKIGRI